MNANRNLNADRINLNSGRRLRAIGLGFMLSMIVGAPAQAAVDIAKVPLFTTSNVPGNLLLVPSVEFPTINSVASLGPYEPEQTYLGYFSSDKCYRYSYAADEKERHFYPIGLAANHTCSGEWSGNFLNWAATQTVDPFRLVLTGGYRVKDLPDVTWVEKARHDGQMNTTLFPNRRIPATGTNETLVKGATPFAWTSFQMRIHGLGNRMYFIHTGDVAAAHPTSTDSNRAAALVPLTATAFQNPSSTNSQSTVYQVSIRVKVCDPNAPGGVEPHCRPYSQGWKPEGMLQQYWRNLRYGVFGYLNTQANEPLRDGGVLRARMKTIGPVIPGGVTEPNNTNKEWDPVTGVLLDNPNSTDASATNATISYSGVINSLNRFGQNPAIINKHHDPVSELYYSATRYLKNQGNVAEYSNMTGTATARDNLADGLPVITNWDDPIQNWCQPNVILGIGDIYTHRDKNLPGSGFTSGEPGKPGAVSADSTVNVVTRTNQVAAMQGITINHNPFTGRDNSAFMAGLAYDAHTRDIRPDLTGGKTTVSTYWVDVLENQSLEGMARNQYALAAKYGGFRVPDDFNPDTHSGALPTAWWHSNGETLTPFGAGNGQAAFPRPDNFFTAGSADKMAESLTKAFESIISEVETSATAAATSSAILQTDTMLFVAGFRSSDWSGMLSANNVDPTTGALSGIAWDAETGLRSRTPASRNIYTSTGDNGVSLAWDSLDLAQRNALNRRPDGTSDGLGANRLDWLRGDDAAHASFRSRSGSGQLRRLGDIVNSNPQFAAGKQNFGYSLLSDLGVSYSSFRATAAYQNRPNVIYVGANDGMLHAFNAQTGHEIFAYIPSELLLPEDAAGPARINALMRADYGHAYFMDGTAAVSDAHAATWASGGSGWKTVLVGTMGTGGRTVFALDITAPESFGTGNVLWEFTDPDLGYGVGQPTIVRMRNGEWAAVFGNGYNSDNDRAALFIVRLRDGELLAKIDTGVGGAAAASNGLASPKVTDWPGLDLAARYIYAGDLQGNVWRFDVSSSSAGQWSNAGNRSVLFQARDGGGAIQPITAQPEVALNPNNPGSLMVLFGTGSYFRNPDGGSTQVQSLYGLIDGKFSDSGYSIAGRGELLQQVIETQGLQSFGGETHLVRTVSANPITTQKGWHLDLIHAGQMAGERVVSSATFPSGQLQKRVRFTTMIPDEDPCGTGRTGFVMDILIASGGQTNNSVFDLNGDGQFNEDDMIGEELFVSGLGAGRGELMTIIRDRHQSLDHMYGGDDRLGASLNTAGPAGRQSWRQIK